MHDHRPPAMPPSRARDRPGHAETVLAKKMSMRLMPGSGKIAVCDLSKSALICSLARHIVEATIFCLSVAAPQGGGARAVYGCGGRPGQ
jgi:hypothetical protein